MTEPRHGAAALRDAAPRVFLRDALGGATLLFGEARGVVTCRDAAGVAATFATLERALDDGLHVAGAFAYELGHALEPRLAGLMPAALAAPLIHVGLFASAERAAEAGAPLAARSPAARLAGGVAVGPALTRPEYRHDVTRVLEYIGAGDVYQVNLTFPLRFPWHAGPWPLYARLAPHQHVAFGAVLELPELAVVSLSPELFFRKAGARIEARPMKGTIRRGATAEADRALARTLAADPKNRAENLMIVDLIRNDLGRIARRGSVRVERLFEVETYQTLHQMTSTVAAEVAPDIPLIELFRALFPCGSVTGAPKIRAIEIIDELERRPRGVYTGAIGWIAPDRTMAFSVPIRTVTLANGEAAMGVGSGIIADSDPDAEFDECLLKARFLTRALG